MAVAGKLFAQAPLPPPERNHYQKVTSYDELSAYVKQLDEASQLLQVEVIGNSSQGRNLYALKFSAGHFGRNSSKIKVIIFAQQHGNEQSGKEGALLLANELLKPENRYLFDKIDLALIPQMNPDGSEINTRQNGNRADLNRNHLLLTQPETQALHRFYEKYYFEVNLDVHEYSPYSDDWKKYGYRRNFDITLGTLTNPNISPKIRILQIDSYVPFAKKYLTDRGFSFFEYCPGGPPEQDYIRRSTFDINDGRQSFGSLNSFGLIQEGMNGTDTFTENLQHRAQGQMTGMCSLLEYVYQHKDEIKSLVSSERKLLTTGCDLAEVSIQADHAGNGEKLRLPLHSYATGADTVVAVSDYRPVVKSLTNVVKPYGYVVPKQNRELVDWVKRQSIKTISARKINGMQIEQYKIVRMDSIDFERDIIVDPKVEKAELKRKFSSVDYIFIPVNQLKGNMIVQALEPKSMLGLVTYPQCAHLLKAGEYFPVLRVLRK